MSSRRFVPPSPIPLSELASVSGGRSMLAGVSQRGVDLSPFSSRRIRSFRPFVGVLAGLVVTCTTLAGISQTSQSGADQTLQRSATLSHFNGGDANEGLPTFASLRGGETQASGARLGFENPALQDESPAHELLGNAAGAVVRPTLVGRSAREAADKRSSQSMLMEVTAYCACSKCCGEDANGVTASGKTVRHNKGRFVAADTRVLPFGTRVSIPGYHNAQTVEVIDRGKDIKGNRLDVFFPSHRDAQEFGRRWVRVTVAR